MRLSQPTENNDLAPLPRRWSQEDLKARIAYVLRQAKEDGLQDISLIFLSEDVQRITPEVRLLEDLIKKYLELYITIGDDRLLGVLITLFLARYVTDNSAPLL